MRDSAYTILRRKALSLMQDNDTQHNDMIWWHSTAIKKCDTQQTETQLNDTQHNRTWHWLLLSWVSLCFVSLYWVSCRLPSPPPYLKRRILIVWSKFSWQIKSSKWKKLSTFLFKIAKPQFRFLLCVRLFLTRWL